MNRSSFWGYFSQELIRLDYSLHCWRARVAYVLHPSQLCVSDWSSGLTQNPSKRTPDIIIIGTLSQNCRGWKGTLEIIESNPPAKQSPYIKPKWVQVPHVCILITVLFILACSFLLSFSLAPEVDWQIITGKSCAHIYIHT